MRISARNQLKGTIKGITPGAVNAEVAIELEGGQEVVSIITKTAIERLGLKPGLSAVAIVKSTEVIIGVD